MQDSQNSPKKFWFKRKLFGWGWIPASWQGWLVTAIFAGLAVIFASTVDETSPMSEVAFTFILPVFLLLIVFLKIVRKTGEDPKWQWGNSEKK